MGQPLILMKTGMETLLFYQVAFLESASTEMLLLILTVRHIRNIPFNKIDVFD
jgi:hypothetical protein